MLFERGKYLIETVETTISMFDRKPYQNIVPFCSRVGNEISRRLAYNLTRQVLRFNSITQLQMFASGLMQPIFANGTIKPGGTLHFHSFLECFSLVQHLPPPHSLFRKIFYTRDCRKPCPRSNMVIEL